MAHIRQQIRDRFISVLAGISGIASFSSGRAFAFNPESQPALSITVPRETAVRISGDSDYESDRTMQVDVVVSIVGNADSDDALDGFAVEIENRVSAADWSDAFLTELTGTEFIVGEASEQTPYALRITYSVRVVTNNPETLESSYG